MTKKALKVLTVLLTVIMAVTAFACSEKGNKGTTAVSLKTPGNLVSNNSLVAETENYFYFVNGQEDAEAKNDYGTPVKGAIAVVSKNDMTKSEIVVPKIVSGEDYGAGIFVYGEYIYYGTTSTKKDTKGNIVTDVLELQKAKVDGSGVSEIVSVNGLSTEYRFVLNGETVYLVYVKDNVVYEVNTSNNKTKEIVSEPTAYTWVEGGEATMLYTENVKKYPDDKDNTETMAYNVLKAYVAGNEAVTVLTGDKTVTEYASDCTYAVKKVCQNEVFVTESPVSNSVETEKTYQVSVANLVNGSKLANAVEVKNADNLESMLYVSTDSVYYANGDYVYEANLAESADAARPVAKVSATKLITVVNGYLVYLNADSKLAMVELNANEIANEIVLSNTVNTSWYDVQVTGGYAFWSDSAADGKQYVKAINLAAIEVATDVETEGEEGNETYTLKAEKVLALGKVLDEDVVFAFEKHVSNFQSTCYDKNQKLNVRDEQGNLTLDVDGKVVNEGLTKLIAEYNALTKGQKELVSEDGMYTYNMYVNGIAAVNAMKELDNFIKDVRDGYVLHTQAEWTTIANQVKTYIGNVLNGENGEGIMNLVDGNLMWNYYDKTEGALNTILK